MSDKEIKTAAKIFIGGKEVTINKLRAGKFYDAQKIIAEMLQGAAKLGGTQPIKKSEIPNVGVKRGKTPSPKTEKGKIPDIKDVDVDVLIGMFDEFPQQIAKFVAVCAEMEIKDLLEKAYPEEISKAFGVCLKLNNVMENLKNSIAPIGELGAIRV